MNKLKSFSLGLLAILIVGCSIQPSTPEVFDNPASGNSMYPFLYNTGDQLYMSWITSSADGNYSLEFSSYSNDQWSAVNTIASDSTWFVNWADFPSIIADKHGPVAAHWLNKKEGGTYAYDVNIAAFNSNSGDSSKAITPHSDGTPTEHGFVSMIPWDDDSFLAVWLDGRKTDGRSDEDYYNLDYAMTLRGAVINQNGEIEERYIIDESVCDCCQTSLIKSGDTVIVAYRNRTENEIRDIYTSRFDGQQWSNPEAVYNDNWEIGACPVNGPKLAAEDSLVTVAWHTAAQGTPTAKYAYSTDKGQTFEKPIKLNKGRSLGRVDTEIIDGRIYVSWIEKNNTETKLKVSTFSGQEKLEKTQTIATLDESRKTGFPQMEQLGNNLIFAWTNPDSAQTKIVTKKLNLD
ncbi:hypothetical protein [Fodinibius sp. Rm-B-1B1-1]|uniref:hypothetical protein n=1 Tax=Fodinibius alkaliphilus TaxID=3140241 RepID=UPI00315A336A